MIIIIINGILSLLNVNAVQGIHFVCFLAFCFSVFGMTDKLLFCHIFSACLWDS